MYEQFITAQLNYERAKAAFASAQDELDTYSADFDLQDAPQFSQWIEGESEMRTRLRYETLIGICAATEQQLLDAFKEVIRNSPNVRPEFRERVRALFGSTQSEARELLLVMAENYRVGSQPDSEPQGNSTGAAPPHAFA